MNPVKDTGWKLWSRLWGGGLAWLLHFLSIWVAAEFGCLSLLARPGLAGVSLVAWIILILSAGFIGVAAWAAVVSWSRPLVPAREEDRPEAFLNRFARAANVIFLLVIVAQTLPAFFYLKECGSAIQ